MSDIQERMKKQTLLYTFTDLKIYEIAEQVGLDIKNYFSSAFPRLKGWLDTSAVYKRRGVETVSAS